MTRRRLQLPTPVCVAPSRTLQSGAAAHTLPALCPLLLPMGREGQKEKERKVAPSFSFCAWIPQGGNTGDGRWGPPAPPERGLLSTFPASRAGTERGPRGRSVASPRSESRAALVLLLGLTELSCIVGPLEFHARRASQMPHEMRQQGAVDTSLTHLCSRARAMASMTSHTQVQR